jgi:hypothetical protein
LMGEAANNVEKPELGLKIPTADSWCEGWLLAGS